MTVPTGFRIERKPSMETEPRTLSLAELRSAREEVMLILSTKTLEEAISIFTQGLKPVRSARSDDMDPDEEEEDDEMMHSLSDYNLHQVRDIVTAPF